MSIGCSSCVLACVYHAPSAGGSIPGALARCVAELVLPPFHDVLFVKCGGVDEMARLEPCV